MQHYHDRDADLLAEKIFSLSRRAGPGSPKGVLLVVTFATIRQYLFVTVTLPARGDGSILCWHPMLPGQANCVRKWARGTNLVRVVNLNRPEVGNLVESLRNTLSVLTSALHADPVLDEWENLSLVQRTFLALEKAALTRN